jgi:hypothetical protein
MFDYRANAEDVAQDLEDAERTSRRPAGLDRLFDVKAILQDGRKSLRGTSPKLRSSSAGRTAGSRCSSNSSGEWDGRTDWDDG